MTYIDRLNALDRWLESNTLTPNALVLYIRLLMFFNRVGWPEQVQVDNLKLMTLIGTDCRTTATRARDKLVESGLIEFQKGKKGQPNKYRLKNAPVSAPENAPVFAPVSAPENAPHNKTKIKTKTKNLFTSTEETTKTIDTTSNEGADPVVAAVIGDYLNRINPSASQRSLDLLVVYAKSMGPDVCKRAFDIAIDAKKVSWNYIKAILQSWSSKGVKCLADVDHMEQKREIMQSPQMGNGRFQTSNPFLEMLEGGACGCE